MGKKLSTFIYSKKLSFEHKGKTKVFSDMQGLKKFISHSL